MMIKLIVIVIVSIALYICLISVNSYNTIVSVCLYVCICVSIYMRTTYVIMCIYTSCV